MRPGINSAGILLESRREQQHVFAGALFGGEFSLVTYFNQQNGDRGVFETIALGMRVRPNIASRHIVMDVPQNGIKEPTDTFLVPYEYSSSLFSSLQKVASMRRRRAGILKLQPAFAQYLVDEYWENLSSNREVTT